MANTALRNKIWLKPAFNEIFASWVNPIETGGGNGAKRPKACPSEKTLYRDRLCTIIMFVIGKHEGKCSRNPDESAIEWSLGHHTIQGNINEHHVS